MDETDVRALLAERDAARAAKDFARADGIREKIAAAGWIVRDTPNGVALERSAAFRAVEPRSIVNMLAEPASMPVSIHLLYEGFLDDLSRFLGGLQAYSDESRLEVVVVDNGSGDAGSIGDACSPFAFTRILHLEREVGWAAARNAGLKGARGAVVVLADLSVEPLGDVVTPLLAVFNDPSVGVAGPFGLVSQDLRSWREDPGIEVDAVEGYLLAVRRAALIPGLIHERFTWYRNADIDLSFQVRALGYRAIVVDLPVSKHEHRGWTRFDEVERAKRSKRNHYVFFDRWKSREDLLLANRGGVP